MPLDAAAGRVLARDMAADRDQPPLPRSVRDGFALRARTCRHLQCVGEVRAGEAWTGVLQPGQASAS